MKKRLIEDLSEDPSKSGSQTSIPIRSSADLIEKEVVAQSGLYVYKYRLSSFPPNVQEHEQLSKFLGVLIPKLMVATSTRLEPFICLDSRFFNDDLFGRIRQSGVTWRALLGFPMIPGHHPFRYLPLAFHIQSRNGWNEVSESFLGTGGIAIYLTALPSDDFFIGMLQLLFTQDSRGQTQLFPLYLPEPVLGFLKKATRTSLNPFFKCVEFFLGENAAEGCVEIVSQTEIEDVIAVALQTSDSRPQTSDGLKLQTPDARHQT